jgi:hypothetical protein
MRFLIILIFRPFFSRTGQGGRQPQPFACQGKATSTKALAGADVCVFGPVHGWLSPAVLYHAASADDISAEVASRRFS